MLPAESATINVDADHGTSNSPTLGNGLWTHGTAGDTKLIRFPVRLRVGARILGFKAYCRKTSATGTLNAVMWQNNPTDGTGSQVGATQSNAANNPGFISLAQDLTGTPHTVLADRVYFLYVQPSGTAGDFTLGASITWDQP